MFSTLRSLCLVLVVSTCAYAQYLQKELSFGQTGKVSDRHDSVPNFKLLGDPNLPQIYSNHLILTPPSPGNQRSAIWGEKPLQHSEWTADVDFRATGPERGGGKMTIWLTKNGHQEIGSSSVYTVGKFDGLALVIDNHGNSGGMVRGFLNDGSTGYSSHHAVDSLAFGHCQYSYRNLGRPSQLKIRQDAQSFKVEVDGNMCFMSSNIRIPTDYFFGVTAVSAEQADSFELFKLVVTTDLHSPGATPGDPKHDSQIPSSAYSTANDPPEVPAEDIEEKKQFFDTHTRLQAMMRHINDLHIDFQQFVRTSDVRYAESHQVQTHGQPVSHEQIQSIEYRLAGIEKSIERIMIDVGDKDYLRLHGDLKKTLLDSQGQLLAGVTGRLGDHITNTTPRLGRFVFIVLGFQVCLAMAYILYKRKRANAPKKYL